MASHLRRKICRGTRTRLMERLAILDAEVDSVLRWIDSELEVSIDAGIR